MEVSQQCNTLKNKYYLQARWIMICPILSFKLTLIFHPVGTVRFLFYFTMLILVFISFATLCCVEEFASDFGFDGDLDYVLFSVYQYIFHELQLDLKHIFWSLLVLS